MADVSRLWNIATQKAREMAELVNRICHECAGRGAYDDPPWGIVRCPSCNGTGRALRPTPSPEQSE